MGILARFQRKHSTPLVWEASKAPSPIYYEIGGRKYPVNYPYLLPKDEQEMDRLNFQHYTLKPILGANYLVPLQRGQVQRILDVGCGTGVWCREMAQDFPGAQVVGVDIDPALASRASLPFNCQLMPADVIRGLPFVSQHFDFVHQRLLVAAIPRVHWPGVVGELVRVTKPGGWIELVECGCGYKRAGRVMLQCLRWWEQFAQVRGIETSAITHLERWLIEAKVRQVETRVLYVPLGQWGGHVGQRLAFNLLNGWRGLRAILCEQIALAPEQFDELLLELPNEWEALRTELAYDIVYGQR